MLIKLRSVSLCTASNYKCNSVYHALYVRLQNISTHGLRQPPVGTLWLGVGPWYKPTKPIKPQLPRFIIWSIPRRPAVILFRFFPGITIRTIDICILVIGMSDRNFKLPSINISISEWKWKWKSIAENASSPLFEWRSRPSPNFDHRPK